MSDFSSTKPGSNSLFSLPKAPKFNLLPSFTKSGFLHFQKYQNVRKQSFDQRIAVCELLKAKANNLFLDGQYEEAVSQYEQALSIFRYISLKQPNIKLQAIKDENLDIVDLSSSDSEEKVRINEMKVALLNNLAACYLKLKDFKNAIDACGEVLFLDPQQTKAWYRRAKATISKRDIEIQEHIRAREDLKRAYELDPKDTTIEELYHQVNEEVNRIIGTKKESSKAADKVTIEEVKDQNSSNKANAHHQKGGKNHKNNAKSAGKKEPEEEVKVDSKNSTQTSESGKENKSGTAQKIDTDNDVWKMLHGDIDPNSQNYNYELSFEINPNAKVPKEIEEFGKYIENRARELIATYEKGGKRKEIPQLRENLRQAIATHKRLENISKLDFSKPGPKLRETASKLNLDLNDPSLRVELIKMQEQNLEDVRKWLKAAKASQPQPVKTESRYEKLRSRKGLKSSNKSGPGHTSSEKSSVSSTIGSIFGGLFSGGSKKEQDVLNLAADAGNKTLNKGINSKEGDTAKGGSNALTLVFYCLIIVFFIYLLIVDQEKQFSKKDDTPDTDV